MNRPCPLIVDQGQVTPGDQGQVRRRDAKVKSILEYAVPPAKRNKCVFRYGRLVQKVLSKFERSEH